MLVGRHVLLCQVAAHAASFVMCEPSYHFPLNVMHQFFSVTSTSIFQDHLSETGDGGEKKKRRSDEHHEQRHSRKSPDAEQGSVHSCRRIGRYSACCPLSACFRDCTYLSVSVGQTC